MISDGKKMLTGEPEWVPSGRAYEELKHVRNHLCGIEALLRQQTSRSADDVAAPIAQAHAVLAVQTRRKKQPHAKQLKLL